MKKYIIAGVAVVAALVLIIFGLRSFGNSLSAEDAAGYVQAELDLMYQGETDGAVHYVGGSKAGFTEVYEAGISAFVENYLTGGVDTNGMYSNTYEKLIGQIFSTMRYQVGEAEKLKKNKYQVTVTYQPVNVFTIFLPELKEEAEKIEEAAANGEYEGSDAEVEEMMLADYMSHSYVLLESAFLDMEYGDKAEFQFTVTSEKGEISMDSDEINTFLQKILELDKVEL